MWALVGFGFYVLLAVVLGIVYSWNWAATVVVIGLIPALLIWLVTPHLSKADDYYDWSERGPHRK